MASLSTGSVNFPTIVYENSSALVDELAGKMLEFSIKPEIEIFDLSHIHGARRLIEQKLMPDSPHVQFVLGVKNAMPAQEHLLEILPAETRRVIPEATWTAAGIGKKRANQERSLFRRDLSGICSRVNLSSEAVPVPWFWTDQGDLKLQMVGLVQGLDEAVVLGSVEARSFSVLCFRHTHLIAVESVNRAADHVAARRLFARTLSPHEAAALRFDLKTYEARSR
jgi:hypothetical protein